MTEKCCSITTAFCNAENQPSSRPDDLGAAQHIRTACLADKMSNQARRKRRFVTIPRLNRQPHADVSRGHVNMTSDDTPRSFKKPVEKESAMCRSHPQSRLERSHRSRQRALLQGSVPIPHGTLSSFTKVHLLLFLKTGTNRGFPISTLCRVIVGELIHFVIRLRMNRG